VRDLGGFIWIVFVLFAVISSIVKSARKAQGAPARGGPTAQPPAAPGPSSATMPQAKQPPQRQVRVNVRVTQPPGVQINPQLASLNQQFEQEAQRHANPARQTAPPPAAAPDIQPVQPPAPAPAPTAPAVPIALSAKSLRPVGRMDWLARDRNALVRGIIASELLGKPLALRDE